MANAKDTTLNKPNGPAWSDKFGRVEASVWTKEFQGKIRNSLSLSRSYQDKSGNWKRTHYFDEQDVQDLEEALAASVAFLNPSAEDSVA